MPIIDMGLDYDGRCAYCCDWIEPRHDPIYNHGVIGHGITHALCSIYGPPLEEDADGPARWGDLSEAVAAGVEAMLGHHPERGGQEREQAVFAVLSAARAHIPA